MNSPKLIENPNISELQSMCLQYLKEVEDNGYSDDNDAEHYIFECAMQTFLGRDVFKYMNDIA